MLSNLHYLTFLLPINVSLIRRTQLYWATPHPHPKALSTFLQEARVSVFDWGIARHVVSEPKEGIGRFVVGWEVVRSVQPQFFPSSLTYPAQAIFRAISLFVRI
jgi:hypothetical protein